VLIISVYQILAEYCSNYKFISMGKAERLLYSLS